MFIKHTSKKIYMHASNEYPGPLLFALWSMINQQILRYMIFGYVTQSWAFPVLFRIYPSSFPGSYGIFCMYGQPTAPCALESESSSLWLLPAPTPSWRLPSVKKNMAAEFRTFWTCLDVIPNDSR